MEEDIVKRLREQERILGEMRGNLLGWMDDILHEAFSADSFLRYAASLGMDFSQVPNLGRQPDGINPYQLLGLEKTATYEEVKKRYRSLVRVLHPDTAVTEGTGGLFQKVTEAYRQIVKERGWE